MKPIISSLIPVVFTMSSWLSAQSTEDNYKNFIRQYQVPSTVEWDMPVASSGTEPSLLAINPGGAEFELHTTMRSSPFTSYLLDSKYVGESIPKGQISIVSRDTTWKVIPRTRCDMPFDVYVAVQDLNPTGAEEVYKKVRLLHHVQSYGEGGTGADLDRKQATLTEEGEITANTAVPTPAMGPFYTTLPGNLLKIRGEERFSLYTVRDNRREDYDIPPSQLASQFIQVWPTASGSFSGISDGQKVGFAVPSMSFEATDLYPGSTVIARAYKGPRRDDVVIGNSPGDANKIGGKANPSVEIPWDEAFTVSGGDLGNVLTTDGEWTIDFVNVTPFDTWVFKSVTFSVDRTIEMNGNFTYGK